MFTHIVRRDVMCAAQPQSADYMAITNIRRIKFCIRDKIKIKTVITVKSLSKKTKTLIITQMKTHSIFKSMKIGYIIPKHDPYCDRQYKHN